MLSDFFVCPFGLRRGAFGLARFFVLLLSVAVLFTGCFDGLSGSEKERKGSVSFTVSFPVLTKGVVTEGGESDVVSLDLLVFRAADGALDCHSRVASDSRVTGLVTMNVPVNWYVVANAPAGVLQNYATESAFLAAETLLSHTTSSSMVMSASGTDTFTFSSNTVNDIALTRYACKVSIGDVRVSWLSDFASAPSCTVERVVIMNARGSEPYSGLPTANAGDLWYNCSTVDGSLPSSLASLLGWSGSVSVPNGTSPVSLGVSLYSMPNPSSVASFASVIPWAPRKSRVAVQLRIGGVLQWYSIDLPVMNRNEHYIIEHLVILGPGTSGPDMDVDRTAVSFFVSVVPWVDNNIDTGVLPVT